jgi:hypothetical protein
VTGTSNAGTINGKRRAKPRGRGPYDGGGGLTPMGSLVWGGAGVTYDHVCLRVVSV